MGFDIGGVQYTATPFTGYWLDAEIGMRNLADKDSYNVLPDVANALGLLNRTWKAEQHSSSGGNVSHTTRTTNFVYRKTF